MATCDKCDYDGEELDNQLDIVTAELDELKDKVTALELAIGTAVKDITKDVKDSLGDLESYVG